MDVIVNSSSKRLSLARLCRLRESRCAMQFKISQFEFGRLFGTTSSFIYIYIHTHSTM